MVEDDHRLRRAVNLAKKEERLARVPYFPMLSEADNVRQDFFERNEFDRRQDHLLSICRMVLGR